MAADSESKAVPVVPLHSIVTLDEWTILTGSDSRTFFLTLRKWQEVSTSRSLYSIYLCVYPYYSFCRRMWVYVSVRIHGTIRAALPEEIEGYWTIDTSTMGQLHWSTSSAAKGGPTPIACLGWRPRQASICAQICPQQETTGGLPSDNDTTDESYEWVDRWNQQLRKVIKQNPVSNE